MIGILWTNIRFVIVRLMERVPQTYFFDVPAPNTNVYQSNYVSTTKYNIFTFFPLALLRQFKRYANIYFLVSALLQCIPLISPLLPFSAMAPLLLVIGLSMSREGYEDFKRYKNDKKSNSSKCVKLDTDGSEQQINWKDVRPSDLLRIKADEQLPADIIPLVSSSENGLIFLQTASLDGQKNLKPKNSVKETQVIYNQDKDKPMGIEKGRVVCIQPNANLYQFQGRLNLLKLETQVQLTQKNLLLRGSILKNTEFVVGLVVYTGHSTKIMKNTIKSPPKISNIQVRLNKLILFILLVQCICCGLSSALSFVFCNRNRNFIDYLGQEFSCSAKAGISFGSYFILYNTFIPISLIVSLEFVKLFQGYFMETDAQMYSITTDKKMKANMVSINQELGQVEVILSDKTGTLTCNKMMFKEIIIGRTLYSDKNDAQQSQMSRASSVQGLRNSFRKSKHGKAKNQRDSKKHQEQDSEEDTFDYENFKKILGNAVPEKASSSIDQILNNQRQVIEETMNIITTCHECLKQPKSQKYQGPSPDEVTLVESARKAGYEFQSNQNKTIVVNKLGKKDEFAILQVFEFDSDRKRMSVIVQHQGVLKLYVKGADTAIVGQLAQDKQPFKQIIEEAAHEMSKKGLRCLYYAMRILPQDLKEKIPLEADVETDLTLLAMTGIEDKLQDFVPETIAALRAGGIKFVLLTGDKLQTAQNISRSCGVISGDSIQLKSCDIDEMSDIYDQILKNKSLSVIADGSGIDFSQNRSLMANIILNAEATVLCRVTPRQKADIVEMVKETGKRTLAVGDGANDCNMILTANVGVGLFGKEGTRASEVADYSIGQFCLLWKLLLYHGRLNYIRISQMILYFFYKNMVFTMPQFVFSFYNMGSGQSVYLSWSITLYNMAFTLLPIVITSVFETDVYIRADKQKLIQAAEGKDNFSVSKQEYQEQLYQYYPKLYYVGRCNMIFTIKHFIAWFALGAMQGSLCLLVNIYTLNYKNETSGSNSHPMSFYFLQMSLCTCIVIVVNVKLALNVQRWNVLLVIGFILTGVGYTLYAVMANVLSISPTQGYNSDVLTIFNFYLTQALSILGMFSIDIFLFAISSSKEDLYNYIKTQAVAGEAMSEIKLGKLQEKEESVQSPKTLKQIEKIEVQRTRERTRTNSMKKDRTDSNESNKKQELKEPLLNTSVP